MTERSSPRPPAEGSPVVGRMRRPVAAVATYVAGERASILRGLLALVVAAIADLTAGLTLGAAEDRLEGLPGLLLLIPAAIAMRGATFGALGARLGTAIHTGQYDASLERGGYLWEQVEAVGVLTLVTSVEAAVLAALFGNALGLPASSLSDLLVVSVTGGVLASVVLVLVTLRLARAAYERGWDMDDVGAPTITATGDLLSIPALLAASFLALRGVATTALAVVLVALATAALVRGVRHPRAAVRGVIRESLVVLTGAAAVSVLAGVVIGTREDVFLSTPALLVLFPPFVALFGSLGGILSSRLTSKLHLGLVAPRALPTRGAALDLGLAFALGVVVYAFVGVATWAVSTGFGLATPPLGGLVATALLGGMLGVTLLSAIAYTAATATFRFGLDPDNHAIPIVTSVMDFLGMLCLVAALAIVGVT